jgi:hypothetical protein
VQDGTLEERLSGFETFLKGIQGRIEQADIALEIMPSIEKIPVPYNERLIGPVTEETVKRFESHNDPIPAEKIRKYDQVIAKHEDTIYPLLDKFKKGETKDLYSKELAEQLGLEQKDFADFYPLLYELVSPINEAVEEAIRQGKPELVHEIGKKLRHTRIEVDCIEELVNLGGPTLILMVYNLKEKKLLGQKEHNYKEQIKCPWNEKDQFSNQITQGEITYLMQELSKRITRIGETQTTITVPGIQEKQDAKQHNPERLAERIKEYYAKIKTQAV